MCKIEVFIKWIGKYLNTLLLLAFTGLVIITLLHIADLKFETNGIIKLRLLFTHTHTTHTYIFQIMP